MCLWACLRDCCDYVNQYRKIYLPSDRTIPWAEDAGLRGDLELSGSMYLSCFLLKDVMRPLLEAPAALTCFCILNCELKLKSSFLKCFYYFITASGKETTLLFCNFFLSLDYYPPKVKKKIIALQMFFQLT